MAEHTFIKGKDADLESSIALMTAQLASIGFEIEEVSWLNPVDGVYSVHIRDKQCHALFTNGKGSSKKACLASALGEFFERLSCNYFFADYYLGAAIAEQDFVHYADEQWFDCADGERPTGLMNASLWAYFDPDNNLDPATLFDINSGAGERGVCALPFVHHASGERVFIPVNVMGNIFVSNGMSAGNTVMEARVQALSEICERYVKHKVIAEGICLPEIPASVIARFPAIKRSIDAITDEGYRLKVADASLGGVFPVISVTLINPKDSSVYASFGAHPRFDVALERTVTELLQGRTLQQMDVFHPPTFDLDEVAAPQNIEMHFIDSSGYVSNEFFRTDADYDFCDWHYDGTTEQEFIYLTELIQQQAFDIYIADYDHLGVPACRILVPGMSDIYPVDELAWENNNDGAGLRAALLRLAELTEEEQIAVYEALEDGGYNDHTLVAQFIGLLPDPQSVWSTVRLGEIKAMLSLALQDEVAIEWVDWCLSLTDLTTERACHYRCVQALLAVKWHDSRHYDDYLAGFNLLYGEQTVSTAFAIVEAKSGFYGLTTHDLSLKGFQRHQRLLEAYGKLQLWKNR